MLAIPCNCFLDRLAVVSMAGPRVEAVDPDDDTVTLQQR